MARSWFGGTAADQVVRPFDFGARRLVSLSAGHTVKFYDAKEGGAQYLDLLIEGVTPAAFVTADAFGYLDRHQGPDGVTTMWADMGDGSPRRLVVTTDGAIAASEDLANKIDTVEKGAINGVAELGPSGKLVQPLPAALIEDVIAQANLPAHLDPTELSATYAQATFFDAERYKTGANTDLQAIRDACAAATAFSRAAVVRLSSRVWDVEGGLSMSGFSCGLVGMGCGDAGTIGGVPTGTVLKASTQSGAVLDLTGWVQPDSFRGKVPFGNFALEGSNVADATKANIGLRNSGTALGSVYFHDIVISHTGGPCVDLYRLYLSEMDRVVAVTPVSAKANDVPYMVFRGCNGNRFHALGYRSMTPNTDTGAGGALRLVEDGGGNLIEAPWFEFLHMPTGGTLIHNEQSGNVYDSVYFVDCSKEAGATGTSMARFMPATTDQGGNEWRGRVPGNNGTDADVGIVLGQSRNRVTGTKGYNGSNVQLNAGVGLSYVELGGAQSGIAGVAGIIDNSGQTTNTLIDHVNGVMQHGGAVLTRQVGGIGTGYEVKAAGGADGAIRYGTGGARIQSVGAALYHTPGANGDHVFRSGASAIVAQFIGNSPALALKHIGALPSPIAARRGWVAFVEGGAGVADRLVVCRKDAADAYAWVDLF